MRYQVPQFTEVEDKVIGQLTIKQFIYIAGAGGMSFIIYSYLPFYLAIVLVAIVIPLGLALAFYKVNNKPFIDFLEAAFLYYTKQNLYIWKKEEKPPQERPSKEAEISEYRQLVVPKLSQSKLRDISWSLDINKEPK